MHRPFASIEDMARRAQLPPQALHLLNNPQVRECAKSLAKRCAGEPATSIDQAYRTLETPGTIASEDIQL